MKRIPVPFLITTLSFLLFSCSEESLQARQERQEREAQEAHELAEQMLESLVYLQDDRVGLCFAYYHERDGRHIAIGLTNVPCDSIAHLALPLPMPDE